MQTDKDKQIQKPATGTFTQRLDFYWQFLAVYAIALLIYGIFKGSLDEGTFTFSLYDPVVILLSLFVAASGAGLLYNYYMRRCITVEKDRITFHTRFREKTYTKDDIVKIGFSKEKGAQLRKPFRLIKIRVKNRRRVIRIRPSFFRNESELVYAVAQLKKSLNK